MAVIVTLKYPLNEPPGFLAEAFIEEEDGTVSIGLLKENGEVYNVAYVERDTWGYDTLHTQTCRQCR